MTTTHTRTVLYLSHGGGPLPLLGDERHAEMVDVLKHIASRLEVPSAIIVISAHWEEPAPAITSGENPSLIYDYHGFPEESYTYTYPAPGHPDLARQMEEVLNAQNIAPVLSPDRGFDHGLFVPLKIMYPQASIPCVQLSLVRGLDPAAHIRLGKALSGLKHNRLLIIGSGFSFHNMRAFFTPPTQESQALNEAFENWLMETCANPDMDEAERELNLVKWEQAPGARYCHPREEHLMPLHVCYGAAGSAACELFSFQIMDRRSSAYLWTG